MNILKDKYLRVVFAIAFVLFLFTLIFSIISFKDVAGPLILHFDSFKGIDFIGSKLQIFGVVLIGLIMLAVNFFLAEFIYVRERFFAYIISFSSLFLIILLLVAVVVISSVN